MQCKFTIHLSITSITSEISFSELSEKKLALDKCKIYLVVFIKC